MTQASAAAPDSQYVTLGIDREVFAVPVETVIEILDMRTIFRVPDAPAHLLGLIDVRGRSVPVIDLRLRLGLPAVPPGEQTRILVLEVPVGERRLVLGLVADRVFEVTALDGRGVEPPPEIGADWRSDVIDGVGRRGNGFVILFNVARLFGPDELRAARAAAAVAA